MKNFEIEIRITISVYSFYIAINRISSILLIKNYTFFLLINQGFSLLDCQQIFICEYCGRKNIELQICHFPN